WTGYHESMGTWRNWTDGAVHDYSQRRLLSFVDWIDTKWKVDSTRVSVGGGSMGGSGTTNLAVHHSDRIAWAAGSVGVHIPDSSPQFTSSYRHCYGEVPWQLPFAPRPGSRAARLADVAAGVSAFNYFSNEWFVLKHPEIDLPLVCFSNGKNDGQIGWKQALRFWRALQKSRQPHVWKWGMGGHGEGLRLPGEGAKSRRFVLDVRTNRTLPAFTRCSLDGNPGTAKQKPRAQYEKEKAAARAWSKEHPKQRRHADKFDGDQAGMSNGWLYWHTDDKNIVDEPNRWSLVCALASGAPKAECTVDVTPRRLKRFKPAPGEQFTWTNTDVATGKVIARGSVTADAHGLVTLEQVKVTKGKSRLEIRRK
ncbi:hypothetical protein LCGC14_2600050, partial [marine sediment metagenome]